VPGEVRGSIAGGVRETKVAVAIGLNFALPGLGYMYMDRVLLGFAALFLVIVVLASVDVFLVPLWLTMNSLMAIDMVLLSRARGVRGSITAPRRRGDRAAARG
jgi:hypothetical protein